ncbi:hypothetical protein M407DRAFT_244321 [Tulasnella calospora MUT 4182]|uniref:TATA-binding protein interacting (TIP20) domain-containing protein n=1 Tax=Tulasnella calospora MUT 4182 TaxID=1051891 RepID=A0A0C3LTW5_9AGAM|nr:hypothetical protein M407DRAFT_244321 [Tulasnella calospora MUT 4182]
MAPKSYMIQGLLDKMLSPDQDFRFMALNDMMTEVNNDRHIFQNDEATEVKVLKQVLALIEDKISEVKNQAVKCLGQLIKIIQVKHLPLVVDKLVEFSGGKEEELRDIAGLALKTVVTEIPNEGTLAETACNKLVPQLLKQLQNTSTPPETIIETLNTLSVLVTRFPQLTIRAGNDPVSVFVPLLDHSRPAVRKKTIITLAQFLPLVSSDRFNALIKANVLPALASSVKVEKQQTIVQLIGGMARYSSQSLAPALPDVVPGILTAVKRDDSDLREGCLQTLETLVMRCPSEIAPYLPQIMAVASDLVKYDPNYTVDDEDEEDEKMDEDEEEDEDDDDEIAEDYSDDEDTSYKVRRSSTKLLTAIIGTRPELLSSLLSKVAPVLISRFGDREESVRLEVWAAFSLLVKQTGVYSGSGVQMEVENSPYATLKSQVPAVAKALLKQLKPKSSTAVLQGGFSLLQTLLQVIPGCLAGYSDSVFSISAAVLSSSSNTSTAALHVTVLSFLVSYFSTHPVSSYQSSLPKITPKLQQAASQRHPRITTEALRAFSALLAASNPVTSDEWAGPLYNEVVARLKNNETDVEVRQRAEDVVADLWICAPDVIKTKGGAEWEALMKAGRTEGAVQTIGRVADSDVEMEESWTSTCTEWTMGLLKKPGKAGKSNTFSCLEVLLKKYPNGIPNHIPNELVPQLQSFLSLNDLPLLTHALTTLSILLTIAPKETFPLVESAVLPTTYQLAFSPLVSGACLDALTDFFCSLVTADHEISTHVVPGLRFALEKSGAPDASPANVAKCISAVVKGFPDVAAGTIAEFAKSVKPGAKAKELHVVLSLLALGEIGKTIDMEQQSAVFDNALTFFSADTEAVRSAAAFAAGNITVGNIHHFFPLLLTQVQTKSDQRIVAVQAMKEAVANCPRGQLSNVAGSLWGPLFEMADSSEDTTRQATAACLGQLTTANPPQYLPELQNRLSDPSPLVRATVAAAIRYTFADSSQAYDNLLAPLVIQVLELVKDNDLTVRRISLTTINAAARNKPQLIRDQTSTLMPLLYGETKFKPELVRIVEMGPWKHKVDDGLEARKTTYETLYTILDTCVDKIDIHEFMEYVRLGLKDDANEIKVLCHMMLVRLAQVAPTAVSLRLDDMAPDLATGMKSHNVEKNTVKQDIERTVELQRSTLRAIAALSKVSTPGQSPEFEKLVDSVSKAGATWAQEFRELL